MNDPLIEKVPSACDMGVCVGESCVCVCWCNSAAVFLCEISSASAYFPQEMFGLALIRICVCRLITHLGRSTGTSWYCLAGCVCECDGGCLEGNTEGT